MAVAHAEAVTFDVDAPLELARWRPLVQWALALPHFMVAAALGYLAGAVAVLSWFAIVFTGSLPEGLAGVQVMAIRYRTRAMTYAGFLTDAYPPFDFSTDGADPGDHTVRVGITPALVDRNRVTVFFRVILVIPAVIVVWAMTMVAAVAWVLGFFAVLATGRWPQGVRDFVVGVTRVQLRLQAYVSLLDDGYPTFSLS